ncbi:hypothetical protein AB0904_27750 [Streptomyces sp. NPDC006684]|uniref:hypothetical protein n=1 Tax=Streptomyces sp. NPDC006684 TaxID=3154477 RepID=UPI0034526189
MTRTAIAAVLITACAALTACSSDSDTDSKPTPAASTDMSSAEAAAGIPPEPTGADRKALLLALRAVAPKAVDRAHEDKAIDAARNQCAAINGGAERLDSTAAARFSYDGVTTSEAQGKAITEALKASGFCKV